MFLQQSVPIIHTRGQALYALIQQVIVTHRNNIESQIYNGFASFRRRIEVEVAATDFNIWIVTNQSFLIDNPQICIWAVDQILYAIINIGKVIGFAIFCMSSGTVINRSLHEIITGSDNVNRSALGSFFGCSFGCIRCSFCCCTGILCRYFCWCIDLHAIALGNRTAAVATGTNQHNYNHQCQ